MEWNQICIEVEKGVLLNTLGACGTTFDTQACVWPIPSRSQIQPLHKRHPTQSRNNERRSNITQLNLL